MTKHEIKEQLKTLAVSIKADKLIARRHTEEYGPQEYAQSRLTTAKTQVHGLLIAYAYLNGKPFSAPEKNPYNQNDSGQYAAIIEAKKVLGMTESKVYPSMTVHRPLPNERFDQRITNTVASAV